MVTVKYACGIDYMHELEEGMGDLFDTIEALKSRKLCWRSCGIVELGLDREGKETYVKWIDKGKSTK